MLTADDREKLEPKKRLSVKLAITLKSQHSILQVLGQVASDHLLAAVQVQIFTY